MLEMALNLGCGSKAGIDPIRHWDPPSQEVSCAPQNLTQVADSAGSANVFSIDPISASGHSELLPRSGQLDEFVTPVSLAHLSGQGVLSGSFVNVINNKQCQANYGAYQVHQQFSYLHSDWRFQEAMSYYFGDLYRAHLDSIGYLQPSGSVTIVAHCMDQDNAYFERQIQAGQVFEFVCLGDSVTSPGASYSDDGIVTVHELEHATTVESYSPFIDLNQFSFDEAGSLNEAISDFMGLIFADGVVSPVFNLDSRIFSRWALGTFDPESSHLRGAHKCPAYDSHFPTCDRFPAFELPKETNDHSTTISYVYPDGLGWPFSNNYKKKNPGLQAYVTYHLQEEIHNNDLVLLGSLWDLYSSLVKNHSGDKAFANRSVSQLVLESVRHLPIPNFSVNHSPVTFIDFASHLIESSKGIPELTSTDQAAIEEALVARGLHHYPELNSPNWMEVGSGTNFQIEDSSTPGVYVLDDPKTLRSWLTNLGQDPSMIAQAQENTTNSRLDPGEIDTIWFDIRNNSTITAGGVLITVTSSDPDVVILDEAFNFGFLSASGLDQSQVMYGKINGTDIALALSQDNISSRIPLGNTYFSSDPFFKVNYRTAIWVRVNPQAEHGKTVNFHVKAIPSNGVLASLDFPVTID